MKIPVIKKLVETYSQEELENAEMAIAEEQQPEIDIPGDDDGERLTHAYASVQIIKSMKAENMDFKTALRVYTSRVRSSIN